MRGYFGPIVRRSKVLEHAGDEFLVFRQLYHRTIVTYVYNMDFRVRYSRPKDGQLECRSFATRGAQVEDVGKPTEREEPVKGNPANQWRLNTYCRAEQREDGTYLEYETLFVAPELPWMITGARRADREGISVRRSDADTAGYTKTVKDTVRIVN